MNKINNDAALNNISNLEGVKAVIAFDWEGELIHKKDSSNILSAIQQDLVDYLRSLLGTFEAQNMPVNQTSFEFQKGSLVVGTNREVVIAVLLETKVSVPFILRSLNVALFNPSSLVEITNVEDLEEDKVPESIPSEDHFTDRKEVLNGAVVLSGRFWEAFDSYIVGELGEEVATKVLQEALVEIGCERHDLKTRDFNRLIQIIAKPIEPVSKRLAFEEECHHLLFNMDS